MIKKVDRSHKKSLPKGNTGTDRRLMVRTSWIKRQHISKQALESHRMELNMRRAEMPLIS